MGITLQEVLVRALKKLEVPSFQSFLKKLSQWEVREEYKTIPKDKLTGNDPEHIAGLIIENFKYAYGAELTLAVLEDIDEKKVREELQHDLREVDIPGHGLGTTMFTDKVNFIENHQSVLIRKITAVAPVLRDLRDQMTRKQYKDVRRKRTSQQKMEDLCDMIRHWEDDGKYIAYTIIKMHEEKLIKRLEGQNLMWKNPWSNYLYMVTFIECNKSYLIKKVTNVDPVLHDLRDLKLLTQEQYNDLMKKRTSRLKMRKLCDVIRHWEDDGKCMAYIILQKHEEKLLIDMEVEEIKLCRHVMSDPSGRGHFVDRHRYDLINNIKEVNPVINNLRSNHLLTEKQYEDLQAMTSPEEKMKHLCDIFWYQSDTIKDQFYISLWRYNYTIMNRLRISDRKPTTSFSNLRETSTDLDFSIEEDSRDFATFLSGHFVDRHRYDLINNIKEVNPVIDDLRSNHLLTEEQYEDLQAMTSPEEKIKHLCDIFWYQSDAIKDQFYISLWKYNYTVMNMLRISDRKPIPLFSNLRETSTDFQLSMADYSKEFAALRSGHFVDRHRYDLINNIKEVNPVIDYLRSNHLLTEEQYEDLRTMTIPEEKMKYLCDIFWYQSDTIKDQFYISVWRYNYTVMNRLRISDKKIKSARALASNIPETSTDSDYSKSTAEENDEFEDVLGSGHFNDRHRNDLINNIKEVNPVIDDLRSNHLLTEEQYEDLQAMTSPEEKMERLCDIFWYQSDAIKDQFYISLWRYNYTIMNRLRISDKKPKSARALASNIPETSTDVDYSKATAEENEQFEDVLGSESSEESKKIGIRNPEVKEEDVSCELCETSLLYRSQDSVEVITPTMTGSTYRLSMNSPGLYRCSESEIQFRVTQSVTIEYEVESWSNYTEILQNLYGGYEIISPLFNIKSRLEPNVVSAVYLPHCLCPGGFMGDKSIIRCFHYKDDNLALETPTRMEAMYAVLENPTFSCFGVILYPLRFLKEEIIKLIPYHGMALLFCNTITREDLPHRYRIHLYLLPRIHILEKEVADKEARYSFQKIHKPPQTKSLYSNKEYRINGPLTARVIPKTLMFESHCPSEVYAFTEISIQAEKNTEVDVSIHPEDKDVTVWETVVNADEMLGLPLAMSQLTIQPGDPRPLQEQSEHFVDRHRAHLIRMISVVDLVVDDLLDLNLLTYEQYNTVLSQNTNAEQIRKLYDFIRAWGNEDKDKVYQCLRQHNCPIIKQLENEGPKDHSKSHTLGDPTFRCNLY